MILDFILDCFSSKLRDWMFCIPWIIICKVEGWGWDPAIFIEFANRAERLRIRIIIVKLLNLNLINVHFKFRSNLGLKKWKF